MPRFGSGPEGAEVECLQANKEFKAANTRKSPDFLEVGVLKNTKQPVLAHTWRALFQSNLKPGCIRWT